VAGLHAQTPSGYFQQALGTTEQATVRHDCPIGPAGRISSDKRPAAMAAGHSPAEVFDANFQRPGANRALLQKIGRMRHAKTLVFFLED